MKLLRSLFLPLVAAIGALCAASGCGHLDTTPAGDPDRVLTGVVNLPVALAEHAEMVVRLAEPAAADTGRPGGSDTAFTTQPKIQPGERVLGEFRQMLPSGIVQPVPFRIEYHADDAVLRRGLNLEVRVSVAGKVRLRTINAHVVTLGSAPFPQDVAVQAVQ